MEAHVLHAPTTENPTVHGDLISPEELDRQFDLAAKSEPRNPDYGLYLKETALDPEEIIRSPKGEWMRNVEKQAGILRSVGDLATRAFPVLRPANYKPRHTRPGGGRHDSRGPGRHRALR